MLLRDIITEDRDWTVTLGSMHKDHIQTLPSTHLVAGTADRTYDLYRLTMLAACSDGKNDLSSNAESWVGRNNTMHPYTQAESDMLKQIYQANGLQWSDELAPNPKNRSEEPKDTNKVSPMTKVKNNWLKHR